MPAAPLSAPQAVTAPVAAGRPRASSREVLAEAACELFLEQGYEATTIAEITRRAGVSRSSFFNYFSSKGDLLWSSLDAQIVMLEAALRDDETADATATLTRSIDALGHALAPDSLVLALANATAMGIDDELERESARRLLTIATAVSARLVRGGVDSLVADVVGAAYGGAVIAALRMWAVDGAGRTALPALLGRATGGIPALLERPGRPV
ncbi:MAG TPA: TetR/AcrR family transcriptional regulator [Microbacteriaceae bacterium]|jgi:AcrR family transcriptional regulator|nr:TetR/AcrR family transcriptional regulator [Microbacteriaceae bacterium]HQX35942.1 TetR/AcrR family transcriptional regulator [Microbacteriaceae bacterium]HQZ48192.1 TetR/AcrR family transcriptional regulator [Microbacteriaceae bacterium]HRA08482.1 TetR/AcrR family transcriptional regulator [Microbacteriaceae bacterium]